MLVIVLTLFYLIILYNVYYIGKCNGVHECMRKVFEIIEKVEKEKHVQ